MSDNLKVAEASRSLQRAELVASKLDVAANGATAPDASVPLPLSAATDSNNDYEECLACQ